MASGIRERNGRLCISHDPVPREGTMVADIVLGDCAEFGAIGWLALNGQSDGLQAMVSDAMTANASARL
jgi:hypothetical protein